VFEARIINLCDRDIATIFFLGSLGTRITSPPLILLPKVGVDGDDDKESDGCLEWMRLEREKKVLTTLIREKVLYEE
jgi:hypothetical protein